MAAATALRRGKTPSLGGVERDPLVPGLRPVVTLVVIEMPLEASDVRLVGRFDDDLRPERSLLPPKQVVGFANQLRRQLLRLKGANGDGRGAREIVDAKELGARKILDANEPRRRGFDLGGRRAHARESRLAVRKGHADDRDDGDDPRERAPTST